MESIQVRTADGVRLVGMHITAGAARRDGSLAIVLAHGFTVSVAAAARPAGGDCASPGPAAS